jgi:hypothetical protein
MKPASEDVGARSDPTLRSRLPVSIDAGERRWAGTVVTAMNIRAAAAQVWESLVFYEGIKEAPPLYLRLLLPRPIRTEGAKAAVGDQALCLYEGGNLVKRVTLIDSNRRYEFTVVEQNLSVGRGVRLSGGAYSLHEAARGHTRLLITTRYTSLNRPRWLLRPIEDAVCHLFHRHLLKSIRNQAEGRRRGSPVEAGTQPSRAYADEPTVTDRSA